MSFKTEYKVIVLVIAAIFSSWVVEASIDFDSSKGTSFWDFLITDVSTGELVERLIVTACIIALGIPLAAVIARKQRLRRALDDSERRMRSLIAEAPLPCQSADRRGGLIDINQSWLTTLGYTADEVIGRDFEEFLTPDCRQKYRDVCSESRTGGPFCGVELAMVKKDGSIVNAAFSGKVITDDKGDVQAVQCLFINVSDRRKFEKALQASEEKYRLLVEHANEAIFVAQGDKVAFCNPRFCEILGVSADTIESEPFMEHIHPDDLVPAMSRLRRRLSGENPAGVQDLRVRAADGSYKWLEISAVLITWEGQPATLNFAIDVTERKQVELALRKEQRRLKDIIEGTNVGTWEWNIQTGETVFSESWAEIIGYTLEELAPISIETWLRTAHPEDLQRSNELLQKHFNGELGYYECEARMRHKDGRWIWVLDRGRVHAWTDDGKPLLISGTHMDITARKQAELTLADERRRLADIIRGTNIGTWEFDVNTGISTISDRWAEMLGYRREELVPVTLQKWNELTHPEDREASNEILRQHFDGERDYYECEVRMRHKNGEWIWILDRGRVHTWSSDGKPLLMSGTHQDITERKKAEEVLRESETRLQAIFNTVATGILIIDRNTQEIVDANQAVVEMSGLPKERMIGQLCRTVVCPALAGTCPVKDLGQTVHHSERKLVCADGHQIDILKTVYPVSIDGRDCLLESFVDISDRVRAEEALRDSKERYKRLLESVTDYIYTVRYQDGRPVSTQHGEGCLAVTGYTPKEFEDNPYLWLEMIVDEDRAAVQNFMSSVTTEMSIPRLEHRIVRKDGSIRWVRNTPSVRRDESGSIVSYEGLISDITEQRVAKNELALSEMKYRTLFESAQDAIFLMKDYIFVDCNSTTCEMFGCHRDQILLKPPDAFSPLKQPDGRESREKAMEKMNAAMAGQPQFFEWTHLKLDGTCFDAEVKLNGIQIAGVPHILAIVRDITERKRSEKALERSLSLQRATLESTADGILVVDRAGEVTGFNRKFLEMWRIPEFLAVLRDDKKLLKYVADQVKNPQLFADSVRHLYANPELQSLDTVEFKDGRVFERHSQPQRLGQEVVGRVWSFRDLTERKRVEMELARLATATEQAAEAIVISSLEGKIEYINPAFERISGYRREEVIGRTWSEFITKENEEILLQEAWPALQTGQNWGGRLQSCRKDGSIYEEECSVSPIRDQNGAIVSYVSVRRDVTQEAELENRLRQSQKLEAVGLLAAGIAHDFNNLLAGIRGFAELLTLEEESGPKVSGYAEEILKAAGRAADLTGQLLAFARKGRLLSVLVNVTEVIGEVAGILERSIDRRIEIRQDYRAERPFISGDPSQVQSAILNLAINARDAMPEGGSLTFRTENVHLDDGYCHLHSLDLGAGEYLAVSVTDTGIGMDEGVMAHIFDPFFTTKAQGQGTGLGLAGVYGCLRNHHGSVEVTSRLGGGSTFTLLFPVAIEDYKHVAPSERRLKLTGEERILLVEDEEVVRNLAVKILTNAGYSVTACADGPEAIKLYRNGVNDYDLILLDMMMPNMHGKDVFAALKLVNPQVCVVLMSGYSDCDVQEVLDQGITGFVPKPFLSKQLLQSVREALDNATSPTTQQSQS